MKSDTIVNDIHNELKQILTPKRLRHTEGVLDYSIKLAQEHHVDTQAVSIAALYHDYFRNLDNAALLRKAEEYHIELIQWEKDRPILLHGKLAALNLKEKYPNIEYLDEIAEAVMHHTTGYPFSSDIGKILFISDSVEVNRDYKGVEKLREQAMENLDKTFLEILKNKIKHALEKGNVLIPNSINTYNKLIMNGVGNDD